LGGVVHNSELLVLIFFFFKQKTAYEIVVLPVTIRVVRYTKRHEGMDEYDNNVNYNIFNISNI